jgi:uncharacterized protein (DUF1800 family)
MPPPDIAIGSANGARSRFPALHAPFSRFLRGFSGRRDEMAKAALALNRFGLGARPDESLPDDPKRWLLAQLDSYQPRPPALASAPERKIIAQGLADYFESVRALGGAGGQRRPAAPMREAPAPMSGQTAGDDMPQLAGLPEPTRAYIRQAGRDFYLTSVEARANAALTTSAPFVERMVHFWSNHFAVSADKLPVIGMAGPFEFEAIRPHVLGGFGDMLLAVEQHPGMLLYLDQAQSVGPDSMLGRIAAARGRNAGLNENLAREILELHTLGVHGGYGQADVTEFARALTGWTVNGLARGPAARAVGSSGEPGSFHFAEAIHQPGRRTILGRAYDQDGERQARTILSDLAAHPATAAHLATKLARHFAGDDPPASLVDRLRSVYLASGGDLPTLYRVLIDAPEVWQAASPKFRNPWDWSMAALRGVGTRRIQGQPVVGLLVQLGQPVWRPGSPAGYDDIAASWAGPDALVRRVEAAERIASRAGGAVDARTLAPRLLADSLSPATAQAIARAESPGQGLALMLVSPEFLRR